MKRLSKGSQFTLLAIALIGIVGAVLTYTDYQRHGDLSTIWWPISCVALFVFVYWRSAKTDIVPVVALLLLAAGATSCAVERDPELVREEATAAKAEELATTYTFTNAEGYDQTVAIQQTWK
ncbi:hypothetical protein [Hymenobacter fodinae]|uniref:Uncharacterized protein n=1 Tax=Hymenobacter fodinae TaxID=2510796 RepID=A0A4Z0P3F3_9BACT|nr:hypothetical protein [Hymenobacter fodinae]TGE05540.1 hypothetical protein EU556_19765 [Hymenobacter fodinae]